MSEPLKPLTDIVCRTASPKAARYRIGDGRSPGLQFWVHPSGHRVFYFQYNQGAKRLRMKLGVYPDMTLRAARELAYAQRMLLQQGTDPIVVGKQRAATRALGTDNTFEAVTRRWHAERAKTLRPRYAKQILSRFENDIFPVVGSIPFRDVTPTLVLQALDAMTTRGSIDIANRVRQHITEISAFAIARGWADIDPAQTLRYGMQPTPQGLRPAVTKLADAQRVLIGTEALNAYAVTKLAGRLLALTAARPGMIRLAEPTEFENLDGPAPIWRVPAAKMKLAGDRRKNNAYEFVLPLSAQAVEVVQIAIGIAGTSSPLVFASVHHAHKPLSDNTLSKFYRDAGFQDRHCPHGWRATFSTIMNERAALADRPTDRAIIDLMLAHVQNGVEPSYNRSHYMSRRRELAQQWADLLMEGLPAPQTLIEEQRGLSERQQRRLRAG